MKKSLKDGNVCQKLGNIQCECGKGSCSISAIGLNEALKSSYFPAKTVWMVHDRTLWGIFKIIIGLPAVLKLSGKQINFLWFTCTNKNTNSKAAQLNNHKIGRKKRFKTSES